MLNANANCFCKTSTHGGMDIDTIRHNKRQPLIDCLYYVDTPNQDNSYLARYSLRYTGLIILSGWLYCVYGLVGLVRSIAMVLGISYIKNDRS